jgi:hypothetical protein
MTLLIVALWVAYLAVVFGAAKDGLSDRGIVKVDVSKIWKDGSRVARVSAAWWHIIGWWSRWPALLGIQTGISCAMIEAGKSFWTVAINLIAAVFVATLHDPIYQWFADNRARFEGDDEMPKWWIKFQKLWRWLPWMK